MDNAFATAPYPSMTTLQLIKAISAGHENSKVMQGEAARRKRNGVAVIEPLRDW